MIEPQLIVNKMGIKMTIISHLLVKYKITLRTCIITVNSSI